VSIGLSHRYKIDTVLLTLMEKHDLQLATR
jgi:hypothetical protein